MKIVIVTECFSEGMGYSENIMSKEFASMGHGVHVISSNLNVYGHTKDYEKNYRAFIGKAEKKVGSSMIDGFMLHRLPYKKVKGYVMILGLMKEVSKISPDIVLSSSVASFHTFLLAAMKPFFKYRFFTENHQHMSVVKPYIKHSNGNFIKRTWHRLTRKLPSYLSSMMSEKCYAISPDCVKVANKIYGVPLGKIELRLLGTDTKLFRPPCNQKELQDRKILRNSLGISDETILCIYTGRFSNGKNPFLLAKAIDELQKNGMSYKGLFIGSGPQEQQINNCEGIIVIPFVKHNELVKYYQIADIGVWPNEESMSMLDAASTGLPIIGNDEIGDSERINGNGLFFIHGDYHSLKETLVELQNKSTRIKLGEKSREKMLSNYSWEQIAKDMLTGFISIS